MIDSLAAVAEFIARSEPNFEFDHWLASRGVDVAHAWNVAGPICVHQVTPWRRGIFNFAAPEVEYETFTESESVGRADHFRAVVHIARDVDDETPVDLIAWPPLQPARIFRYLGNAVMLGFSQLYDPASYFAGGVLPVHRTPLDWLAAGCRGIVILDFKEFAIRLSALPKRPGDYALGAADLTHARLLRASIGRDGAMVSRRADDTGHARVAFAQCAAELAIKALGQPNYSLSIDRELRFGNRGSLAVVIEGPRAGFWYDHENGQGGDLIDLIRHRHGSSFREALHYIEQFIGPIAQQDGRKATSLRS